MTAETGLLRSNSVKICSLREPHHGRVVVEAGADLFGLIFSVGRRQVTTERAAEIVGEARSAAISRAPVAVGVFVDPTIDEIERVVAQTGIDVVQLHGECSVALLERLSVPAIVAMRVPPGSAVAEAERRMEPLARSPTPPLAYMIDGFHERLHGGSGVRADWTLAAELASRWPIVLAGGLTPENVGEAIAAVRPLAVDVSSGTETDGQKDEVKIRRFAAAAKAAFGGTG